MSEHINNLRKLILAQNIAKSEQEEMLRELKKTEKKLRVAEFKAKRTLIDKKIITNVLNQTIEELNIKSDKLEQQKALVEEQVKFKEKLFANVSHELRTPLNGILGMSYLFQQTILDKKQQAYVEVIKSSADNLLIIINDILNLSKINAGQVTIMNEPFESTKMYSDLYGLLIVKAKEKNLKLIFETAPNIPRLMLGDRTRISQILLNLLNNAVKFTHEGVVKLRTTILQNEDSSGLELFFEIIDTGIGMKKEQLESIFESFVQVHESKERIYEGTGLGLNIVKNLLYLMKGTISVDSEPNIGTRFAVRLPIEVPLKQKEIPNNKVVDKKKLSPLWKHKKLIYIEDNKANILYAKHIFENWEIPLDIAETTTEGRSKLKQQKYDCILSDIKLPDGNGLELLQEIREDITDINHNTPMVVLTASANEAEEKKAKKMGIHSYISKPFPPNILLEVIIEVLAIKQDAMWNVKTKKNANELNFLEKSWETENYLDAISSVLQNDTQYMLEAIEMFLDDVKTSVYKIQKALQKKDLDNLYFHIHSIKSIASLVGLKAIKKITVAIEKWIAELENENDEMKIKGFGKLNLLFEYLKQQIDIDVKHLKKVKYILQEKRLLEMKT
ncbi:MAG: ATP-binding protein [Chitinophagales bacterium]